MADKVGASGLGEPSPCCPHDYVLVADCSHVHTQSVCDLDGNFVGFVCLSCTALLPKGFPAIRGAEDYVRATEHG